MPDAQLDLPPISDELMQQMLPTTQPYSVAILRKGPQYSPPRSDPIIWEHGRRNFALRSAGLLSVVLPVRDGTDLAGISIFNRDVEETERIMRGDPAVAVGVLTFEVHPTRSFPGDQLPYPGI